MQSCGHQEIGNIAWAFATLSIRDLPLLDVIAVEAIQRITHFNVQGMANTAWALAKVSYQNMPFFHCIAANAMATMSSWDPQAIANLSWAYATISFLHDPLMVAVSQRAVMVITEFTPQNLSNSNVDHDFGIEEGSAVKLWRKSWNKPHDNLKPPAHLAEAFGPMLLCAILRSAHSEGVTAVGFVPEGVECNLLITRSMDNTMKIWDCRMMSDAKGPVKVFDDLRTAHEKTGLCTSPDGRYVATGTSLSKNALGAATLRVYDVKTMTLAKSLDFGKKSVLQLAWPKDLNQILATTTAGDVVVLYSPFSSRKGALHFVGKKAKSKSAFSQLEEAGTGPIFNMTDPDEIKKFYSTGMALSSSDFLSSF
eukprot:symbB.v1.2.004583.t1/scaffold261.1/size248783/11